MLAGMKIVTVIAVFAALVSTAWAAGLAKNSVKSKQLKDNSVQSVDIADGSLSAVDVADGSLGSAELDASLRTSSLAAHPSFPTDASTVDVITIPGVGAVLGRCTPTIVSIGYSNRSASEQSVAALVRPATGGAGGSFSAGSVKPEGASVAGVTGSAAEGRIRLTAAGQYVDADVVIARTADASSCDAWAKVTLTPTG
jgi:hypothetical protein